MPDEFTRKLERCAQDTSFEEFLAKWRAALVVLTGENAGSEFVLEKPSVSLGRGPGVEIVFADEAMSRAHAAFEFSDGGFRVRDLGSTNGTFLNGGDVQAGDLANGDRLSLGEHRFQFVLEERRREPATYALPDL